MRHPIRLFLHNLFRHYCWYIVFFTSIIVVSSAYGKPPVFTMSEEEREQANQQKLIELQSMRPMTLELDTTTTNLLTEQTYVDWQNTWVPFWLETFYTGADSYQYIIADALWGATGDSTVDKINDKLQRIVNTVPLIYYTNIAFNATTEEQLDEIIGKLDRLASSDSDVNVNVNFQPIQQVLSDIHQETITTALSLQDIANTHLPDLVSYVDSIFNDSTYIPEISEKLTIINDNASSSFNEANRVLNHIDNDLHQLQAEGIPIDFDSANFDGAIGKHFDKLAQDMQQIADEKTERTKLDDDLMQEAFNEQQGADYVLAPLTGAQAQLESELSTIQYTNINLNSYNYEEYNNYFTLQGYADDPPSNDEFIRQKIQDYIDQVYYSTENVKGQIVSRLDELKQSTLLTTNYKPEWLVVKRGALSQEWNFPKTDWKVDFSDIKVDSEITKTIYDVIYYVLAIVIIYKQFSKVV